MFDKDILWFRGTLLLLPEHYLQECYNHYSSILWITKHSLSEDKGGGNYQRRIIGLYLL